MDLDISTLVLVTIAVAYGLGVVSIAFSFLQAGTRGARHWGAGMVGLGTGYTMVYLYPHMDGRALVYAGWACLLASILLMYRALRLVCDNRERQPVFSTAVFGGAVAGWSFFSYVVPNQLWQIDTTSVAVSVITGRAAWDLWRHARHSRYRAPALAVAAWLLVIATTPIAEILMRGAASGPLPPMSEYGPPAVVFARVLILSLLSISVLWLEISRLYEAIEIQATHDELTGVSNRRAIVAQLQRELARARREKSLCSVAIMDIDFFKRVNDTWGHPAGDQVLKWVTKMIAKNIRPYDTLGRYGGEEFLMVMPAAGRDVAIAIAERAREAIQEHACVVDGVEIRVTISAGIAVSSTDADFDAVLQAADRALYLAKEGGRNRIVVDEAPAPAKPVIA